MAMDDEMSRTLKGTTPVDVNYRDFLRLLTSAPEMAQSYENLLTSLELLSSGRPLKRDRKSVV